MSVDFNDYYTSDVDEDEVASEHFFVGEYVNKKLFFFPDTTLHLKVRFRSGFRIFPTRLIS